MLLLVWLPDKGSQRDVVTGRGRAVNISRAWIALDLRIIICTLRYLSGGGCFSTSTHFSTILNGHY